MGCVVLLWCLDSMKEDETVGPTVPRNVPAVEGVDLEETPSVADGFFQSVVRQGRDESDNPSLHPENLAEGTLGEWDTSLVDTGHARLGERPFSKRD